uniref:Hordoindoline c n=2 Tax=Hordeum TaxID=4512 RepID=I7H066_9POAL|nr:hordoindoline c [Hordeum brachyantherum subsp. californicum]
MKSLFLLALLSLVVSTTFAQYKEVGGSYQNGGGGFGSQNCPPEKTKLDSCKDYVMEQCLTVKGFPIARLLKWWKGACEQEVLDQCCQQLRPIEKKCRCEAIWRAVQGNLGGVFGFQQGQITKRIQRAMILPSKCKLDSNCKFVATNGYYW